MLGSKDPSLHSMDFAQSLLRLSMLPEIDERGAQVVRSRHRIGVLSA